MNEFIFTETAHRDMLEIWEFVAKDDLDAADRVRDAVYEAVGNLVIFPGMGYRRADLGNDALRVWPVFSYGSGRSSAT